MQLGDFIWSTNSYLTTLIVRYQQSITLLSYHLSPDSTGLPSYLSLPFLIPSNFTSVLHSPLDKDLLLPSENENFLTKSSQKIHKSF